jgi:hypothetical protein
VAIFMSTEYIRIWKEVAMMVYFKEIFRYSPEETEERRTFQLEKPVNHAIF